MRIEFECAKIIIFIKMAKKKLFFYSQGVIVMPGNECFSAAFRFLAFCSGSLTSRVIFTYDESSRGSTITLF